MLLEEELQRISRLVRNLTDLLRSQREILRQRGMNLPPTAIQSLNAVQKKLEDLAQEVLENKGELAQLRALANNFALINSTLNIDEVLNRVMDTVIALTGAERGYIALREEGSGEMTFRVARNLDRETLNESEFIVSRTVVQQVAASGEPVLTDNAREDARFSGQESVVGFSLRSILCVPLKARGEVIGVAYADNRIRAGLFSGRELALLSAFADQAAVAIQNARLFARVRASLAEITELKDLLDNVFTSIASGVITTDAEDVITLCNPAARAILNLEEGRSTGMRLEEVLPLGETLAGLLRAVREEGRREAVEVEPEVPARGVISLSMRLSPMQELETGRGGVAIVMDDLTEEKQREAQLAAVRRYLPPAMVDNIQSIEALALGGSAPRGDGVVRQRVPV
ncbi:MAG: GAF domain-containing protein [Anaerolineae bacterium]|nr:GAF domain-containing protein [Anaerolineae bacterium]